MISKLRYFILLLGVVVGFGLTSPVMVGAETVSPNILDQCKSEEAKQTDACKDAANADLKSFIGNVVNGLLYILGAMSVLVLVIAGIFYTTSMSDPAIITKAKNAIIYAIIGLIVSILAYSIVNFVIGVFK